MDKKIRIESYRGEAVRKFIPAIAKLRMEVFREYPYLYIGDEEYEKRYLEKFITAKDAIVVVAWDKEEIIGISTGFPFIYEAEAMQRPFLKARLNADDFFYFGEFVLQKKYRGRGIGHQFFVLQDEHVRNLGRFKYICLCVVKRSDEDPKRPLDYKPSTKFWQDRGFVKHPELIALYPWQEIDEDKETLKEMVFWIKQLKI